MRCISCGTHQLEPRPTPEQLAEAYGITYYEDLIEGAGMAGGNDEATLALRQRLHSLELRRGKGSLVDLGCGLGPFVKYAADNGWTAVGIETSKWAATEGRRRYGITILEGTLENAPIEDGSLDVMHAHHVFEHMIDPLASAKAAYRLLKSGGLLVIEVPQQLVYPLWDSFFSKLHPDLYRTPPPPTTHHLEFFTPEGLARLARRAGFEVERASTVRHVKSSETRFPLGLHAKRLIYWLEQALQTGPDIELWARKP